MRTKLRNTIGCYVDCSAYSADSCNRGIIEFAAFYGFDYDPLPRASSADYSEALSWVADESVDFLNSADDPDITPAYAYWTIEDNSLFLLPDIESARENVDFISSKNADYPPAEFRGPWLHVSDHGNCTLYERTANDTDFEIWSVV